jgi:hypothetical protein
MNNFTWFFARNEKRRNKLHFDQCLVYFRQFDQSRRAAFFATVMPQMLLFYTIFSKSETWQNTDLFKDGLNGLNNITNGGVPSVNELGTLSETLKEHMHSSSDKFENPLAIIAVMATFGLAWSIDYLVKNTEEALNKFFLGNLYETIDQNYDCIEGLATAKRPFYGWSELERRREIFLLEELTRNDQLPKDWQKRFQQWSKPLFEIHSMND